MGNKVIIFMGFLLLLFYFLEPIPYCKIIEQPISLEETTKYTQKEISEILNLDIILLNIKGNSMFPTIYDGSKCLCIKKTDYVVGDIVFFFANINGEWAGVSHRIFSIIDNKVVTKGDKNNWVDPPMPKENIVCAIPYIPRYKVIF